MIVCVCNAISDQQIRSSAELGITCFDDLQQELGVGTCCGLCQDCAREVLEEQLREPTRA